MPGRVLLRGVKQQQPSPVETRVHDWGPRLGLAYRLGNSTVIRGGYGMSYLPTNTGLLFGPYYYYESSWGLGDTNKLFGTQTPAGAPIYTMENPAVSPLVLPVGANPAAPASYGYGSNIYPRNYGNAYMQQYNLIVEHKIGNWLLSAGFSGSKGSRLPITFSSQWRKHRRCLTPPHPLSVASTLEQTALPLIAAVSGAGYLQTGC